MESIKIALKPAKKLLTKSGNSVGKMLSWTKSALHNGTSSINNPIMYGIIVIILSMYGPRLGPKLPKVVRDLFSNSIFRLCVLILVVYLTTKNLQSALIVALTLTLVINITNSLDLEEHFTRETLQNFSDFETFVDVPPTCGAMETQPVINTNDDETVINKAIEGYKNY